MTQTLQNNAGPKCTRLCRILVIYCVALQLALLALVFKTNFLQLAGKTIGWLPPEEWNNSLFQQVLDAAQHDKSSPPGAVVLLGDSIIANLGEQAAPVRTVNLAIGGDTVRTLRRRLPTLRTIDTATTIVVGVGVNDLKYRKASEITKDHDAMLARLPPSAQVMALSILPIEEGSAAARRYRSFRNDTIREINNGIRKSCQTRSNCRFLDTYSLFEMSDATTRHGLYSEDGWHLSTIGVRKLNDAISSAIGRN